MTVLQPKPGSLRTRPRFSTSNGGGATAERLPGLARGCRCRRSRGFTLAGFVVILAVLAIMATVAAQTVSFQARREREEELIFRGKQAVEAIRLFRARNGRFPVSLDELVKAKPRVLRKAWKDPMTGKVDWVPVFLGQEGRDAAKGQAGGETPGSGAPGGMPGATGPGGLPSTGGGPAQTPATPTPSPFGLPDASAARGPIVGVRSRSCEQSIKVYDGHTRYCDWKFVFDPQQQGAKPVPKN